ncbi:hypothetical protein FKM82_011181 [Ascaphus truei]
MFCLESSFTSSASKQMANFGMCKLANKYTLSTENNFFLHFKFTIIFIQMFLNLMNCCKNPRIALHISRCPLNVIWQRVPPPLNTHPRTLFTLKQ